MVLPPLPPSPSQNAAPHFISVSPYTSAPPPLPCSHMCDDPLPFLDSPSFPRNTSQSHACTEETCTVELTKKTTTRNLLQSSVFSCSLSTGASRVFVSIDLEGIKSEVCHSFYPVSKLCQRIIFLLCVYPRLLPLLSPSPPLT